jgi:hypothetical protein
MLRLPSAWRVAVSLCVLVIVITLLQLNSITTPQLGTMTPRITTDKDVYHVGDTVHAEYSYVNTNSWIVLFSPPNSYYGMNGSYENESSPYGVLIHATYVSDKFVVPPGEAFNMGSQDFKVGKVGRFSIWCGSASKVVDVLP